MCSGWDIWFLNQRNKEEEERSSVHPWLHPGGRWSLLLFSVTTLSISIWPAEVAACQRHSHIQPRYSLWHCPRFANSFISLICLGTSPSVLIICVIHCVFTGVCFDVCHSRLHVCDFVHLFSIYSIYVHMCPNYHSVNCNQLCPDGKIAFVDFLSSAGKLLCR